MATDISVVKVRLIQKRKEFHLDSIGFVTGFMNKMERMTHIDFNRDNIIGHPGAFNYGYHPSFTPGYNMGYPPMGYGYGPGPYGYY